MSTTRIIFQRENHILKQCYATVCMPGYKTKIWLIARSSGGSDPRLNHHIASTLRQQ